MSNLKPPELAGGRREFIVSFPHVLPELLLDLGYDLVHLGVFSFHDQFNPAIGQIPHISADGVARGDSVGCVPEPNALNTSAEMAYSALHVPRGG
jgi:hypothetical protein